MASVQVRFSPGFPLGGGFPAEQLHPWWCLAGAKKPVSSGALRIPNTVGASTRQFALREITFSAEIRILPEQLSPEHPPPKSNLSSPPAVSYFQRWSKLLCGKSSS
jgi:hypothetical protein